MATILTRAETEVLDDMIRFLQTVADYRNSAWAENADTQRAAFAIEARSLLARGLSVSR